MALVIHDEACPALCRQEISEGRSCSHHLPNWAHTCTCTAAAQLEELVSAAIYSLEIAHFYGTGDRDRLDAALRPFRKGKP